MKRFIEGASREQGTLFPECLEDWIGEDNPVRVIDVFVDELDLGGLGFARVAPKATGRPAAGTSWRSGTWLGGPSRTRRPVGHRAGLPGEPSRGFCQDFPLLPQPSVLTAKSLQLHQFRIT